MNGSLAQDDLETCAALQKEEWEVLEVSFPDACSQRKQYNITGDDVQSIHPECLSSTPSDGRIKLEIPVDLPESTVVSVRTEHPMDHATSAGPSTGTSLSLSTLPPILLEISLPPSYPFTAPLIRATHATYSWLPPNDPKLRSCLANKWEQGEGVLYTWVEWIRSGDFLEELKLVSVIKGQRTIQYVFNLTIWIST